MQSFAMLETGPAVDFGFEPDRFYIDGKRVPKGHYRSFMTYAKRQDTFHSETRNGRHYTRSCCYI